MVLSCTVVNLSDFVLFLLTNWLMILKKFKVNEAKVCVCVCVCASQAIPWKLLKSSSDLAWQLPETC